MQQCDCRRHPGPVRHRVDIEFRYSLYLPSIIAWACLMRAMETWQLTSDHLHLTTSVVAKEANNFMHHAATQTSSPLASARPRPTCPSPHGPQQLRHVQHHHYKHAKLSNGLDHHVLKANLAALDWS